ncbi:hypothetical protein CEXT_590481 [Caerostris extrusa]|uniref:Uncharacterized protein n=1 Tax=Caerostris extrusa TaxID=172846 RepID=A0AAV4T283_CAEEX|nr:hypothetical protein CEXT_590481 [Caerostris extrusa]
MPEMDNSLKAIWDKSDEYYIRMRDAEDHGPVHVKKDNSKSSFESEDEYVDAHLSLMTTDTTPTNPRINIIPRPLVIMMQYLRNSGQTNKEETYCR